MFTNRQTLTARQMAMRVQSLSENTINLLMVKWRPLKFCSKDLQTEVKSLIAPDAVYLQRKTEEVQLELNLQTEKHLISSSGLDQKMLKKD